MMANHFPKLNKRNPQIERWDIDIDIYYIIYTYTHIHTQVHTLHTYKSTATHIVMKLHNTKDKNKIFQTIIKKFEIVIEATIKSTANLSAATNATRQWNIIF